MAGAAARAVHTALAGWAHRPRATTARDARNAIGRTSICVHAADVEAPATVIDRVEWLASAAATHLGALAAQTAASAVVGIPIEVEIFVCLAVAVIVDAVARLRTRQDRARALDELAPGAADLTLPASSHAQRGMVEAQVVAPTHQVLVCLAITVVILSVADLGLRPAKALAGPEAAVDAQL